MRRSMAVMMGLLAWLAAMAAASAQDKLVVGLLKTVAVAPIFIAQERGMFAAEGLAVELRFFEASNPIVAAVTAGDADIGATALLASFFNVAGKGGLRIIAVTNRGEPGFRSHAFLVSPRSHDAGFRRPAQFAGRAVAMPSTGGPPQYAVGLLARKYGFDVNAVRFIPLQSFPNVLAALKGEQAEATILPANIALSAEARGEARIIGWIDDEVPWQLGGIFAAGKMIDRRRGLIERYLRAYRRAARAYHDAFLRRDGEQVPASERDSLLGIIARHTGQAPALLEQSIAFIDPDGRVNLTDIAEQIAFWQGLGFVAKDVDATKVVDTSFAP